MASFASVSVSRGGNPSFRLALLSGQHSIAAFLWLFVGSSVALCYAASQQVASASLDVSAVLVTAVLTSALISAAASVLVWRAGPGLVLRQFSPRRPFGEESELEEELASLATKQSVAPAPRLMITGAPATVAMAVSGSEDVILISKSVLELLDPVETKAVLAHELVHLRNRDSRFKVFSSLFSRVMFFDPFTRLLYRVINVRREYLADAMAAQATGKPVALASALLKLDEARGRRREQAPGLSIVGKDGGPLARYPPLKERIERLLRISAARESS